MSMISELLGDLEVVYAHLHQKNKLALSNTVAIAIKTIKELSAKLAMENMERSTAYYNGGWIPRNERLHIEKGAYLVTTYAKLLGKYIVDVKIFDNRYGEDVWVDDYDCDDNVIAWMPLPEPYPNIKK